MILHVDGDSFFVACEMAKYPALRGKPVVTGYERGIASAMSTEAKALGVTRGMPVAKIRREFPEVIVVSSSYKLYEQFSRTMVTVLKRFCDVVERYSIDECFAIIPYGHDETKKMELFAEEIRKTLFRETGISFSIGIGQTKTLAKVATHAAKPEGCAVLSSKNYWDSMEKTPIAEVWGVGRRSLGRMRRWGIGSAADFVRRDHAWVVRNFSAPFVETWQELCGNALYVVDQEAKRVPKSITHTRTFGTSGDRSFLLQQLSWHTEAVCRKLRKHYLATYRIGFFLKSKAFAYHWHEFDLLTPVSTPESIMREIDTRLDMVWDKRSLYRTTGVRLSNFVDRDKVQRDLFREHDREDAQYVVQSTCDSINKRFGSQTVMLGSSMKNKVSSTVQLKRQHAKSKIFGLPLLGSVQ